MLAKNSSINGQLHAEPAHAVRALTSISISTVILFIYDFAANCKGEEKRVERARLETTQLC